MSRQQATTPAPFDNTKSDDPTQTSHAFYQSNIKLNLLLQVTILSDQRHLRRSQATSPRLVGAGAQMVSHESTTYSYCRRQPLPHDETLPCLQQRYRGGQTIHQSINLPSSRAHIGPHGVRLRQTPLFKHSHLGYSIVAVASTRFISSRRFVTPAAVHHIVAAWDSGRSLYAMLCCTLT
jgi:hypothetical protein